MGTATQLVYEIAMDFLLALLVIVGSLITVGLVVSLIIWLAIKIG